MSGIKPTPADVGTPDAVNASNRRALPSLIVIVVAAGGAILVWSVIGIVLGTSLDVRTMPGGKTVEVNIAMVAVVAILAGLAAWWVLLIAQRAMRRGTRVWRIFGVTLLVLSLLGPVAAAANARTLIVLLVMHGVVGLTLLIFLPRARRPKGQRR